MKRLMILTMILSFAYCSFSQEQYGYNLLYQFKTNKQIDTLKMKCHTFNNLTLQKVPGCGQGVAAFDDSVLVTPILNMATNAYFETGWYSLNLSKSFGFSFFYRLNNSSPDLIWFKVYCVNTNNQKILIDSVSKASYSPCHDYDWTSVFLQVPTLIPSGNYKIRIEFGGNTHNVKLLFDNFIMDGEGKTQINCLQNLPYVKNKLSAVDTHNGSYKLTLKVDPNTNDQISKIVIQIRENGVMWKTTGNITPKKKSNLIEDVIYDYIAFIF